MVPYGAGEGVYGTGHGWEVQGGRCSLPISVVGLPAAAACYRVPCTAAAESYKLVDRPVCCCCCCCRPTCTHCCVRCYCCSRRPGSFLRTGSRMRSTTCAASLECSTSSTGHRHPRGFLGSGSSTGSSTGTQRYSARITARIT